MADIKERKVFWQAELIYKSQTLTEQGFKMYFDDMDYKKFKKVFDDFDGNKNTLFSRTLNTHTLTMIYEAFTDKLFSSSLERVNKNLYEWDIKISCVADGKEIPFNQINQAARNRIAEDILENGNVSGMEYDTPLPSLDDRLNRVEKIAGSIAPAEKLPAISPARKNKADVEL